MTESEALIRSIVGAIRHDIRPLACAIDVVRKILFVDKIPMDDILVTKDVYRKVAKIILKKPAAVERSIERLANLCWDKMVANDLVPKYIGKHLTYIHEPRDVIIYLAFYLEFKRPFFEVIEDMPVLLF